MKIGRYLTLIVVFTVFTSIEVVLAAGAGGGPPGPPGGGGGPPCWPPPCTIPLDGGISLLIAAGALYGGKKMYDNRKKNPA
jgi:hypothetical protein